MVHGSFWGDGSVASQLAWLVRGGQSDSECVPQWKMGFSEVRKPHGPHKMATGALKSQKQSFEGHRPEEILCKFKK